MWPEVIAYVRRNYHDAEGQQTVTLLVADMRERHELGIVRYGVPLTSGNGRNSMIDAYQELLDFVVYTRTWLDEQGIEMLAPQMAIKPSDAMKVTVTPTDGKGEILSGDERVFEKMQDLSIPERVMVNMFSASTEALLTLRGLLP